MLKPIQDKWKVGLFMLGVLILLITASIRFLPSGSSEVTLPTTWPYHPTPLAAGYNESLRDRLNNFADSIPTDAILIVADGKVLWEYGDTSQIEAVASVRKSVLAVLYGKYVDQGIIDLNLSLEDLGIDDVEGLLPIEKEATIEHLLTARSGVYHPAATYGSDSGNTPERGSQNPGEYFLYNNWDFNVAGTIFEKLTGSSIFDALENDLAIPLGFEQWEKDRHSRYATIGLGNRSNFPSYAIYLSVRDMARIGQLMLQDGQWNGEQLISSEWAQRIHSLVTPAAERSPEARESSTSGYGYLWFVIDNSRADCPMKGAYLAQGIGGQNIIVLPQLDMVIATRTQETIWRFISGGGTSSEDLRGLVDEIVKAKLQPLCT